MEDVHLTPRELLRAIIRRLHWVLLAAILGGMFGFCLCRFWLPPQYTATGSLYVSIPGSESADPGTASAALTAAQKLAKTCLVLLESDRVLDLAAQQLAPDCTAEDLSPHPAWGTRKPSLFLSPTETLRLPRSLPTPSWTPPRLKFSGSSTPEGSR